MTDPTQADLDRAHLFLFGEGPRVVEDHNNGPFAVSPRQIARLIATVRAETQAAGVGAAAGASILARVLTAGRAD